MVIKDIEPNNELVREKLKKQQMNYDKEASAVESDGEDYVDRYIKSLSDDFVEDLVKNGFKREHVEQI